MKLDLPGDCLAFFVDDTGNELLKGQKVFGLGGCAVMASYLDTTLRIPWREVRRVVGGSPDARLHATDVRNPTSQQIDAVATFFRTQPVARFGAICSVQTELDAGVSPIVAVARSLGNRIAEISSWQPFSSVEIIFEHSQRLSPQIENVFGGFDLQADGRSISMGFSSMDKSAGEPALEVADFLVNAIGAEVRHRIAQCPGHAKSFEAFFHHVDKRLVSFIDVSAVRF